MECYGCVGQLVVAGGWYDHCPPPPPPPPPLSCLAVQPRVVRVLEKAQSRKFFNIVSASLQPHYRPDRCTEDSGGMSMCAVHVCLLLKCVVLVSIVHPYRQSSFLQC